MTARERAVEVVTDALIDQATVTADHVLTCLLANPDVLIELLIEGGLSGVRVQAPGHRMEIINFPPGTHVTFLFSERGAPDER